MQYQQGDVLVESIKELPEDVVKQQHNGKITLMEGEVTGHAHVTETKECECYVKDAMMYIKSLVPWELKHEEHNPITIPPGIFKINRVREFDHLGIRERYVED